MSVKEFGNDLSIGSLYINLSIIDKQFANSLVLLLALGITILMKQHVH